MTAGVMMMSSGCPATSKSPAKSTFERLLGRFHRCVQQDCVEDRTISLDEKPPFPRMTTVTVTLRKRSSSKERRPNEVNVDIDRRYSLRYRSRKANVIHVPRLRPHSFVNSQEWTLSRSIVDLKLGVLGTVNSGKSALVHRYLTGAYVQEESPEGGRFKKEIVIDSQSYLLLIRDEAGLPEQQFSQWVDAVIFVFSLENERSFAAIYSFYAKMAHYLANLQDIPIILVGTQDAISESNPRLIDDSRARKLASDLRRCSYYETCATYGLNVERVFQDACLKILQSRLAMNPTASIRSSTPNHMTSMRPYYPPQPPAPPVGITSYDSQSQTSSGSGGGITLTPTQSGHHIRGLSPPFQDVTNVREPRESRADRSDRRFREPRESRPTREFREPREHWDAREPRERRDMRDVETEMALLSAEDSRQRGYRHSGSAAPALPSVAPEPPPRRPMRSVTDSPSAQVVPSLPQDNQAFAFVDAWNAAPCSSTPLLSRKFSMTSADDFIKKGLRKSESFSKADDDKNVKSKNGELGIGRVIPLKQGFLYKKSSKPLSKEWKKKYVTLLDDGRLTYHPSLHDYMNNVKGKEISLVQTTVKIPGKRPRGSEMPKTNPQFSGKPTALPNTGAEAVGAPSDSSVISNPSLAPELSATPPMSGISPSTTAAKPDVKKRQRRTDGDTSEFMVVSLENITWHFDASSLEERDEWVDAIQQQIMTSLQLLSSGPKNGNAVVTDRAVIQEIRSVSGNSTCADCDALDPSWASLNLGILVCIECCGIHRNLGTHLSRIRSLDLDEWPPDTIVVMTSIGNQLANSIWEANTKGLPKPKSTSPREEKEKWIQSKYKLKEFLPPLPFDNVPYTQQLIDAVARQLIERTILVLAYCNSDHINAPYSKTDTRTALHIASALGNSVLIQLLIWYGANVKVLDHEGHNPLFYARSAGAVDCVELLLSNGCLDNPTLPRRRTPNLPAGNTANTPSNDTFNKLPTSII